jgi:hypothetical protein
MLRGDLLWTAFDPARLGYLVLLPIIGHQACQNNLRLWHAMWFASEGD